MNNELAIPANNYTSAALSTLKNFTIKRDYSKNILNRLLSETIELLKATQIDLTAAQKIIAEQEAKIALLEKIATSDELTGLKNRRGFKEAFDKELDRVNRSKSMGGILVVIDLDNFKGINDTYGHLAGDACLKRIADILNAEVRIMDTAARLGGDEFVVLMASTEKAATLERVQKLAWNLNTQSLMWDGVEIPLHASVGVKTYGAGDTADDIFDAADQSLYAHKEQNKAQHAH